MCMQKTGEEKKWNIERQEKESCDMQESGGTVDQLYHLIHKYLLIETYRNRIRISSILIVIKTFLLNYFYFLI